MIGTIGLLEYKQGSYLRLIWQIHAKRIMLRTELWKGFWAAGAGCL
mgnify:CR=1 FL=1